MRGDAVVSTDRFARSTGAGVAAGCNGAATAVSLATAPCGDPLSDDGAAGSMRGSTSRDAGVETLIGADANRTTGGGSVGRARFTPTGATPRRLATATGGFCAPRAIGAPFVALAGGV